MKRLGLLVVVGLLAACEPPPLTLKFRLVGGESQQCYSDTGVVTTSCSEVTMDCPRVVSIRVVPPGDPTVPYISECKALTGGQDKLCSIASITLEAPSRPIPEQVLEVQMAIFPESVARIDPDTGELICPIVEFGANDLPVAALEPCVDPDPTNCPVVPAVGGRTFYYPGDEKTVVELGCTDMEQLRTAACSNENQVAVTATVADFDTSTSVSAALAQQLSVSIGTPVPLGDAHVLTAGDATLLDLLTMQSPPSWMGTLGMLGPSVCLVVDEEVAQSTTALTCRVIENPAAMTIDITGVRLKKATLDQVLAALGKTAFPDAGLVVGIVLDHVNNPVAGATISASHGMPVKYLSADRTTLVTGATSTSGIFLSEDAPYGTIFERLGGTVEAIPGFGGLVQGKVTVVLVRHKSPPVGGG